MFDLSYQKEVDMMRGIINKAQVVTNTYYKLSNDANIKRYLEQAVNYAKSGGSRDKMGFNDHYFVIKQNDEVMRILGLLVSTLLEIYIDKSGEELAEPRSIFPDHGGETLLRILGFMPLLQIVSEHVKFSEYLKLHYSDEDKDSMLEFQRERLFSNRNLMRRYKFPNDDKFINYELRNEYTEKLKAEFDEKESELLGQMHLIASALEDEPTLSNDSALKIGLKYWDTKREIKQSRDKETSEMFTNILTALAENTP